MVRDSLPMRIAIVTESFLPTINGVTNSVLRILEHLGDQGHTATVIAPENSHGPTQYQGHSIARVPALPLQSISKVGLPLGIPSRRLETAITRFNPDLVQLASPFILGGAAARIAKKMAIPCLSVYQTDLAGFAKHYGLSAAGSGLQKLVGKIHRNSDRTLVPSFSAMSELHDAGVTNTHLWRRGVNTNLFTPQAKDSDLRQRWFSRSSGTAKILVGYVGRIANEKRLVDLKVIDQNPDFQLIITGDGPARSRIEKELPNAIFTGYQFGIELAKIYASLDIFVHPGPHETFCQSVQEALASGVPCIVPKTGGPAELVINGETGFIIDTGNPESLLGSLNRFVLRRDRTSMSEAARDSVSKRTWPTIMNELMDHYSDLIENTPSKKMGARSA